MRNSIKLIVLATFGIFGLGIFLIGAKTQGSVLNSAVPTPTPPRNTNARPMPANAANVVVSNSNASPAANAANAANAAKPPAPSMTPSAGGKTITKKFVLGKDSLSEYGEVPFDHETHAFGKYNPAGDGVVACIECHHTDQPKSALKPPLLTSERDVVMTFATWQASDQKVSECRACHFQDGNVPDSKEMPTSNGKDLNNELAYHINCNTCHDAAFKLRPDLKKKPGFATSRDCTVCHVSN
jgi:hypothetical protein